MSSTSPGQTSFSAPSSFVQTLPGAPSPSLYALTSFVFRQRRYIVYISGCQLSVLTSPTTLVQALTFKEELIAVSAEASTGKLVVAAKSDAYTLEPVTQGWRRVWWEKVLSLRREDAGDEVQSLSWGSEGEVLVGGRRQLSLFSTLPSSRTSSPAALSVGGERPIEERRPLWSKSVSSPVQYAEFSPTSSLIATCATYDKLVKIWRRLSFEEGLFDYTYLPHSNAVTHLEWRHLDEHEEERRSSGMSRRHDEDPEVLFTVATDGVLCVWRTAGLHDLDILVLHTSIDLVHAIPHSPTLTTHGSTYARRPARFIFITSSNQFCAAITAAVSKQANGKVNHSLEHLKEIHLKAPDVIVTLDSQGRMSAWGLQSIGHKRRPETPGSKAAFHVAHTEDIPISLPVNTNVRWNVWFDEDRSQILVHTFDDGITWWQGDIEAFFSPSTAGAERLHLAAAWSSGHISRVKGLRASEDGKQMVSWSDGGGIATWSIDQKTRQLKRIGKCNAGSNLFHALVVSHPNLVVTLNCETLALWTTEGTRIAEVTHGFKTPEDRASDFRVYNLATVASASKPLLLRLLVLDGVTGNGALVTVALVGVNGEKGGIDIQLSSICELRGESGMTHAVLAGGSLPEEQEQMVGVDADGTLYKNAIRNMLHQEEGRNVQMQQRDAKARFKVGLQNAAILAANRDFAALASLDGTEVIISDLVHGYVEFRHSVRSSIKHLRFSRSALGLNLLAVGYEDGVDLFTQARYEHQSEPPAWILVKEVSIAGLGLQISAMEWLQTGSLAIGVGNGIIVTSSNVSPEELQHEVLDAHDIGKKANLELSHVARKIKAPLPVWHPSFLSHLMHHGEAGKASSLLSKLLQGLKFWSEGEALHPVLDQSIRKLTAPSASGYGVELTTDLVSDLMEQLDQKDLPAISQSEQERLKRVLEAIAYCSEHAKGLDKCALRYLFSWKLQQLRTYIPTSQPGASQRPNGVAQAKPSQVPKMHWREIAFAYHSTTQQPLLDILVLHYDNKLTWTTARDLGITAWLSDRDALEQIFESLAQAAYRQSSPPDPTNATLYFLALHKKTTLLGLWRIATWHKEQRATMNFLRRDFMQLDARTAAKKNAYALMGRRRFEYAAAFFLLANDPSSATSVLAGQCEDIMLAIAIARLYCGDGSPVLRTLLQDRVLPQAKQDGDRWLMSWCHSLLSQKHEAARVLVELLEGVRTWHQDDPSTLLLYRHLRSGIVSVDAQSEYYAVLRAARILRRMGLWLLALELVRNWDFMPHAMLEPTSEEDGGARAINGASLQLPSMLGGYTETPPPSRISETPTILDSVPSCSPPPALDDKAARVAKAAELLKKLRAGTDEAEVSSEKKPEPTQFKEPDADNLLSSFGL